MSGSHHMYTKLGRPIPPPPKRTPQRHSSVCRTPTRRCRPSERRVKAFSERSRSNPRDGWVVSTRGERETSPCAPASSRTRLLIENGRRSQHQQMDGKCVSPWFSSGCGSNRNSRPEDWQLSTVVDDRQRHGQSRAHNAGGAALVSHPNRSFSPQGSEYYEQASITERLRSSMSCGYSPQRGRQGHAVVGTELMARMPRLQGTRQTSRNRDRMTLERFIQSQPAQSRQEMLAILEEYRGREEQLCDALNDAYGDTWVVPLKSSSPTNNRHFKTSPEGAAHEKSQSILTFKGRDVDVNKVRYVEAADRSSSYEDMNATRDGQHMSSKFIHSAQSSPSRPQRNFKMAGCHQTCSDFAMSHRSEGTNRNRSLEMEHYEDDVSPHPRRNHAGASVPRVGTVLEYRERSPRSGGMLTPPLPHDLLAC